MGKESNKERVKQKENEVLIANNHLISFSHVFFLDRTLLLEARESAGDSRRPHHLRRDA
jgi:hypothetical protein